MDWDVFWSVLVVMFIIVPLLMIWGFTIVDLFTRPDIRGITKALWLFGIVFFPIIGTIAYFVTRPAYPEPRRSSADAVMDKTSLPKVAMPARPFFTPDTRKQLATKPQP